MARLPALPLLLLLLYTAATTHCRQYKVGDLDCWGPPLASNSQIYSLWSQNHRFKIGDSLMFLYPPSQDSVLQVTEQAFAACATADPVLKMADGNSVFNFTAAGAYYFTSGVAGRCEKHQKLSVTVLYANGSVPDSSPADGGAAGPSSAYPVVFGPSGSPPSAAAAAGGGIPLPALAVGSGLVGLVLAAVGWI